MSNSAERNERSEQYGGCEQQTENVALLAIFSILRRIKYFYNLDKPKKILFIKTKSNLARKDTYEPLDRVRRAKAER